MAALQAAVPPCRYRYTENNSRGWCTTHDGLCCPAFCDLLEMILADPTMLTLHQLQEACWILDLDLGETLTASSLAMWASC